jgi:hypothetical protein
MIDSIYKIKFLGKMLKLELKLIILLTLLVCLTFFQKVIWHDLQSEEMQLAGQWAPLLGAGLILVAAFVGKYWPKGERLSFNFQERREMVRSSGIKEGILESLTRAWKERENRSAWS